MNKKKAAFKVALPYTIPVFAGYLLLGSAYGILMTSKGFAAGWTLLMSVIVFAGAMQFVALTLLVSAFDPLAALGLAIMVNIRHLFYGISMLERFKGSGILKPYLIFGMTDETFSLICATKPPEGVDRNLFMFFMTLQNHIYWIFGSAVGVFLGNFIMFDVKGLDFVLTALFVVIFLEQWKDVRGHFPALIGLFCSWFCLVVFGPKLFIIPSMLAILAALALSKNKLEEVFKKC